MIVISRMKDEGIVIGDGIMITVTEILDDEIRLHIERPPGVPVEKRVGGGTAARTMEEVAPQR